MSNSEDLSMEDITKRVAALFCQNSALLNELIETTPDVFNAMFYLWKEDLVKEICK